VSSLGGLIELLIPPKQPVGHGTPSQWQELEGRLGRRLPHDYKEFVDLYGFGAIDGYFWVLNPFVGPATLQERIAEEEERHLYLAEFDPSHRAGLIPWGHNDDGGTCYWETDDSEPDRWTVLTESGGWTHCHSEGMTMFLVQVLAGNRLSTVLKSRLGPFTPPVYYYPWFKSIEVHVRFQPADQVHMTRLEAVRETFRLREPFSYSVTIANSFHMFYVPPRGWECTYISIPGEPTGTPGEPTVPYQHELRLRLPEEDLDEAKQRIGALASALGTPISSAWRGGTGGRWDDQRLWPDMIVGGRSS
jgi:hypothetical protein